MIKQNDPLWSAIARWVFGFIRWQLRCGQTLNEIESNLMKAVENGELYSFMRTFEDVKNGYANRRYEEQKNVSR